MGDDFFGVGEELAEEWERWGVGECAEGFAGFVAHHRVFGEIGEDGLEWRRSVVVFGLAETVGEFVLCMKAELVADARKCLF